MNKQGDLVKLVNLDSEFIIDMRYATENNFTGQKVYESGECWINEHTAKILIEAKNIFKNDGFRVKIWDAYRPISAQERFWEIMPNDDFVARPPDMSKIKVFRPTHMNGMCVDITLTDMNENEIEMPSEFDDMTERASICNPFSSEKSKENAKYMRKVMERVGFKGYDKEWWHFYDLTTKPVPFLNFQI